MLIAFDCRIIRDKNPAGISRVVLEFLKTLLSTDRKNNYILIFDNLEIKDFVSYYLRHIKKKVKILIVPYGILTSKNLTHFPRVLKEKGVNVYYQPYYFCSPFIDKKIKVVLTIFDLIHFFYPYLKMSFARRLYHKLKLAPKLVLKRADKIITISISTSRDLIKYFKIPPRKIKMLYMGVSESFRVIDSARAKRLMREKFNVTRPYILFLGRNEPHKNIKALVIAYARLPEYIRERNDLVLVGKEDERYNQPIRELISRYGIEKKVFFTGYADDSDLPYIYSAASVYVQPSFYEGFGLPILEAMACGVPVVSSNTSCLPEVGGDAALYFSPVDVHALTNHIKNLLDDSILREEMIKRGLKQVKNFTWFNAVNGLLECFNDLGGEKNNV